MDFSTSFLFIIYLIISIAGLGAYFYFIFMRKDLHTRDQELGERGESVMVNRKTREFWLWMTNPIEEYLVKNRFHPNTVSFIGFAITSFSCIAFTFGWVVVGGWCVLLGGTMDIFDGRVARRTGKITMSGDYLDANLDRISEALMYLGLLNFYANQLFFYVVFTAFMASMMISYSKARGYQLKMDVKVGLMQRPERIVWIGIPAIFSPLFAAAVNTWLPISHYWLSAVGITVVAMMGAYTYWQRFDFIYKKLK